MIPFTSFGKLPNEPTTRLSSLLQLTLSYPSTSLVVRMVSATVVVGESSRRIWAKRFVRAVDGGGIASRSRSVNTEGVRGARDTPRRGVPLIGRAGEENISTV